MIKEKIADYRRKLHGIAFAYNRVFDKQSVHTTEVLKDLARFCRAHETTFHADPRLHAVLEGRREVWLKIQQYLQLSTAEIYELHKIKEIIPKDSE
jgi:hypothetical protein